MSVCVALSARNWRACLARYARARVVGKESITAPLAAHRIGEEHYLE